MNSTIDPYEHRLLIVDDNSTIHDDIRKILCPAKEHEEISRMAATLFGTQPDIAQQGRFTIDSAYQGQEGLTMVKKAVDEKKPYSIAFVDMRMPPGWDGIETIRHIWNACPDVQIVICTAYSDHSWGDIIKSLGQSDGLLILKKPFDNVEVLQLAHALAKKWLLARAANARMNDLDEQVNARTAALSQANAQLRSEVTQRAAIESALRSSEERFQKAFRAASVPMAILHAGTHVILDANDRLSALAARTREEIIGQTPTSLSLFLDPGDDAWIFQRVREHERVCDRNCRIRRHAQENGEALVSVEPVQLAGEDCLLIAMLDVTAQRQLEAQLRQAQKMEAVGQLAAGVAHDFNNLLTVIQGHTSLQLARAGQTKDTIDSLKEIGMATDRAGELTKRLLAFSRKQVMQRKPLDITACIVRVYPMLLTMVGESVRLKNTCPTGLPAVFADANCLEQIIINLTVNARDATPPGGTIHIDAESVDIDEAAASKNPDARKGRFVCLQVTDTGSGMDEQVLARIFEPFFTTKEVGKGTGLGLSTVYGIAKQHEGWVEVSSKPGAGSSFRIYLPVSDAPIAAPIDPQPPVKNSGAREMHRTVLVVEDESSLRRFICAALERHGYRVLQAGDGIEAKRVWQTATVPIDLLLTDMVMPNGITGADLARDLSNRSATLKVLYTSGYSAEVLGNTAGALEQINFLPKPFDISELIRAAQRTLGGAAEALLRTAAIGTN